MNPRFFILAFLLGLLSLPMQAQQRQVKRSSTTSAFYIHLNKGNKLLNEKDSLAAANEYLEAIKANPRSPEPYERVAMIYFDIKERSYQQKAKMHYEKFFELTHDEAKQMEIIDRLDEIDRFLKSTEQENSSITTFVEEQSSSIKDTIKVTSQEELDALLTRLNGEDNTGITQTTPIATPEQQDSVANPFPTTPIEEQALSNPTESNDSTAIIGFVQEVAQTETKAPEPEEEQVLQDTDVIVEQPKVPVVTQNEGQAETTDPQPQQGEQTAQTTVLTPPTETASDDDDPFNPTKPKPKPSSESYAYNKDKDPLYKALIPNTEGFNPTLPLYTIQHLAYTPLADELFVQTFAEKKTSTDGTWASTLRNSSSLKEMFIVKTSATDNNIEILPGSDLLLQEQNNGLKGKIISQTIDDKNVVCEYSYEFVEPNLGNVERFIASQVQPYLGMVTQQNRNRISLLRNLNNAQFKVNCTYTLRTQSTKNALHGNLTINMTINHDATLIPVLSQTIPCTLFRTEENYAGFDCSAIEPIDLEREDTAIVIALHGKTVKSADELNNLGFCYLNGRGVKKNLQKALTYFENAAQKGCKEAFANLYIMYNEGLGGKRDVKKAWEQLAAGREAKSEQALNLSADLILDATTPDDQTAFVWFSQSHKSGNAYALYRLGQMSINGIGQPQSYQAAYGRFEQCKTECSDGYYEQALMELNGLGREKSAYKAYQNALQGAQSGSIKAMQMVAEMYLTGVGVRRSLANGIKWIVAMKEKQNKILKGYEHIEK